MNNPSKTVDRLSRGYMREELRKLTSKVGVFSTADSAYHRAYDIIEERVKRYFGNKKRLPEDVAKRLRADIKNYIRENFVPVAGGDYKSRIHGFEGRVSEVNAYYYFQPCLNVIVKEDGTRYEENSVELRHLRLIVDRRRVVIVDFSCNIAFTEHMLTRLVERGACPNRPLEYLANRVAEILFFVPMFTVATLSTSKRSGVLIPTSEGVLVGDFVIATDPMSVDYAYRRRLLFDEYGSGVQTMKDADALQADRAKKGEFISTRMSTFLDLDTLGNDKRWCWEMMSKLRNDYAEYSPLMIGFLTSPEVMSERKIALRVKPLFDAFAGDILYDPRWNRACKINLATD